jgi:hypothetical protein
MFPRNVDNDSRIHYVTFLGTKTKKLNSVTLVREPAIPTERQPLVGEVSANFCEHRVWRSQHDGSLGLYYRFSRTQALLFLSSGCSVVLTRPSGPRSRPTTSVNPMPGTRPQKAASRMSEELMNFLGW